MGARASQASNRRGSRRANVLERLYLQPWPPRQEWNGSFSCAIIWSQQQLTARITSISWHLPLLLRRALQERYSPLVSVYDVRFAPCSYSPGALAPDTKNGHQRPCIYCVALLHHQHINSPVLTTAFHRSPDRPRDSTIPLRSTIVMSSVNIDLRSLQSCPLSTYSSPFSVCLPYLLKIDHR